MSNKRRLGSGGGGGKIDVKDKTVHSSERKQNHLVGVGWRKGKETGLSGCLLEGRGRRRNRIVPGLKWLCAPRSQMN